MHVLSVLNSFLLPSALGVMIIKILIPKKFPLMMIWMMGFGLGIGLLSQLMLVLHIFKIPFSLFSISFPILMLMLALSLFFLKRLKVNEFLIDQGHVRRFSFLDAVLAAYIIIQIVFVFWQTNFIPFYSWDVISTHAFSAKVIFYEGSLAFHQNFPHREYPLQIPFIEAWMAFNIGHWNDQLIKSLFFATFLSFITVFYYFFKSIMNNRWALVSVVFLLSSNFLIFQATTGYREFMLAYYNTMTFLFIFFWYRYRQYGWLILAGLFSGFCSFIKLEGLGYILLHMVCLFILLKNVNTFSFRKKVGIFAFFSMLNTGIASIYLIYKKIYFFVPEVEKLTSGGSFDFHSLNLFFPKDAIYRFFSVFVFFIEDLFFLGNWNIIWFLVLISLFKFSASEYKVEITSLIWSVVGFFFIYFAGFSLTQHYFWLTKYQVLSRAFLHFFPLSVVLLMFLNFPSFIKFDD